MMKFSSNFGTIVGVLVILVLSFVMVACGSPGASVAEIQTEEVKSDDTGQETKQSSLEIESSQEISSASSEQMNQPLPDSKVFVKADFEVRPIEEVYTDGPPTLRDITSSDATPVFVSNIPLACSMVYGGITEQAQQAHLDAVEVWTRSMSNNTAQIFEFTVTTDSGEVLGPFTLPDANEAYRFDVDVRASTLRFDVVDSNGGNTGLVEFAAYGTPVDAMDTDTQEDATNSDEIDPDDNMN